MTFSHSAAAPPADPDPARVRRGDAEVPGQERQRRLPVGRLDLHGAPQDLKPPAA